MAAVRGTLPSGVELDDYELKYEKDQEGGWVWGHHRDFTPDQFLQLQQAVRSRRSAFAYSTADLVGYHGQAGPFRMELIHDLPIFEKKRRFSHLELSIQDEKCTELEQYHIISPQVEANDYAANVTMPAKKDAEGNWTEKRMCVDYRQVNEATKPDHYGLHHVEEIWSQVGNSTIFSKIDLRSGFHQLPIAEEDKHKTAFWWRNRLYRYDRMPFGLKNASAA
jgi:hypothetical protein